MKSLITVVTVTLLTTTAHAASFKLDANGAEPLYQTTLTKEVYQNSKSDFLQDLSISNANGESVPYSLVIYEDIHENVVSEETKPLAIFPMQKDMLNQAGVNIQFNNHGNDTRVNVTADDSKTVSKTYYLFDLGEKHPSFKKLLLDWQGQEGKLLTVDVLMSNDLKHWVHAGQGAILNVSTNEQSIIQNSISLDKVITARYLQILPQDATESFQLTSAHVEVNQRQALTQPYLWQEITYLNREQNNVAIHIDFESQSRLPATLLNIELPQKNTITQAVIYVRNDKEQPWRRITSASLYHLNKLGKNYHNQDIHIPSTTARYWRLSFNQNSGGIGQDNPKLSLGWSPAIIVWNARGADPFDLQVGQASNNNINRIPVSQLIKPYDAKKIRQLPIANLRLISQVEHFNAWESPKDFKRFWLWTGLFIGVFALALMAYSLLKSNSKT
jgi:hypothetical protein